MTCDLCGTGEFWMTCRATGTSLCLACVRSPGPLGGPEHPLPNGNWCAHRPASATGGPATRIYTPAEKAQNG